MCGPSLGILPITCGVNTPLLIASSALWNNQPFLIPDWAIKSAAFLFAIADIISAVVPPTVAFKFFSGPNNVLIAWGSSSPVFNNL